MKGAWKLRGLIRVKEAGKCIVCGEDTYIFDIDLVCNIHPSCQLLLNDDFVYADREE